MKLKIIESWKKVLIQCLGSKCKRYCTQLIVLITAVDQEVKIGFLWDCFNVDPDKLDETLKTLYLNGNTKSLLKVMKVYDEIFVVKPNHLLDYLKSQKNQDLHIIDVSYEMKLPNLMSSQQLFLSSYINVIIDVLENYNLNSVIEVNSNLEECNPCTLYGVLLGYPVIYWFKNQNDNCLTAIELIVHTTYLKDSENGNEFDASNTVITSFSYPKLLDSEVKNAVQAWLANEVSKKMHFDDFVLDVVVQKEEVNPDAIVL